MRNLRVLVATSAILATAACVETTGSGYPVTSYGYAAQPTYYSQPVYYSRPAYYAPPAPVVVTQTRYVPVAVPVARPGRLRDRDHDGIPDRYDRERNGDGIPDRYQGRRW